MRCRSGPCEGTQWEDGTGTGGLLEKQFPQVALKKTGCVLLGLDLLLNAAKRCSLCRTGDRPSSEKLRRNVGGRSCKFKLAGAPEHFCIRALTTCHRTCAFRKQHQHGGTLKSLKSQGDLEWIPRPADDALLRLGIGSVFPDGGYTVGTGRMTAAFHGKKSLGRVPDLL